METAISIIVGGLITILISVCIENLRRPKLQLSIEDHPLDSPAPGGNRMRRNLRLVLRNKTLPVGARWMQRAAALQCRGEITFHHLDGQDVFGRSMAVRFARSPEPILSDVYPGEGELLDVAVRFDDDNTGCYGWNNDSYFHNWRTPDWRLPRARYLVKAVITSSGQKCRGVFRLVNDVESWTDFRLLPATSDDEARVR
jgi:hypothetical protein